MVDRRNRVGVDDGVDGRMLMGDEDRIQHVVNGQKPSNRLAVAF